MTPYEVVELFNNTIIRVATLQKAIAGFRVTGIFSQNPDVFTDEDFAPAEFQRDRGLSEATPPREESSPAYLQRPLEH